jgi:putative tricarboxylic transport membrane protein
VRINDALFGAALLLLAATILVMARSFPEMPGQDYGPNLFPSIAGVGFGLCGAVLLFRGVPRLRAEGIVHVSEWAHGWGGLVDVALIVGGLVLWMLVWNVTGFMLGGTLYATALMVRFRGKPLSSFLVALVMVIIIDFAFRRLLLVPLPLGPLTGIIW